MKILLPLIAVATILVGCERIEGQLDVSKDVKLVNTKGSSKTIRVGTYSADIKANTKKKITLRLNNDRDEKFEFNIPNGSIPTNGSFFYGSAVVGQPVNLSGTVATVVTDSERRQTTESCQYQNPVYRCRPGPQNDTICNIEMETRFGIRWIEYFDRTTDKDVNLSIAVVNTNDEAAQFNGNTKWVDRIVTNSSQCR